MQPRTVINKIQENTGPQTKYGKVQDRYKITGIYRTAGITAIAVPWRKAQSLQFTVWDNVPEGSILEET